jgi:hypothetical protein
MEFGLYYHNCEFRPGSTTLWSLFGDEVENVLIGRLTAYLIPFDTDSPQEHSSDQDLGRLWLIYLCESGIAAAYQA